MKQFRRVVTSTMPLPVIVQSDAQDVFAVVIFAMLRDLLDKVKAGQDRPCPYCGYDGKPKRVSVQCGRCGSRVVQT